MVTTSWKQDDEQNVRHYTELVTRHGIDPRSLDWGSRESQLLRFAVLAEVANLDDASVLDVGCGLGDFYGWLTEQNVSTHFHGVDITPKLIETARERFPGIGFDVENPLERDASPARERSYDFVFSSGIFAYRITDSMSFLKAMVTEMFGLCKQAVAFNSLSAWYTEKEEGEFYADPLEVLEFCRSLTPWVVLRHDYHPRDFTIYMHRERNA